LPVLDTIILRAAGVVYGIVTAGKVWLVAGFKLIPHIGAGLFTVNVTVNDRAVIFAPETVTIAVCVPAASPARGCTVKVRLVFPTVRLVSKVEFSVKLSAFAPDSLTVRGPVVRLPVLVTVILCAAGAV